MTQSGHCPQPNIQQPTANKEYPIEQVKGVPFPFVEHKILQIRELISETFS